MANEQVDAAERLIARIVTLDSEVFPASEREPLAQMLAEDQRRRRQEANRRDAAAWADVKTREEWEAFRAPRIAALRASLGDFPPVPRPLPVWVTRALDGDGYRIENLVYES